MPTSSTVVSIELTAIGLSVQQSALALDFYVFAVDGKTIAKQLGVRRMKWQGTKFKAEGFQRALNMGKVHEIASYLSNNPPILPNALVVAFEKGTVEFTEVPRQDGSIKWGTLKINGKLQRNEDTSLSPVPEGERIAYVIDGQHRLKAIEESTVPEGSFPVIVCAFHNVESKFQLNQFYALNQTTPISPSLLALLRKELGLEVRGKEAQGRAIATVRDILQQKPNSPFEPERYVGSAIYKGPLGIVVVDRMIDRAVKVTNLKYRWRSNANEIPASDLEYVAQGLYVYWKAVSGVFEKSWGKRPAEQRLFTAIGLYTLIQFYDVVMDGIDVNAQNAVALASGRLGPFKDLPWDGKMLALPSIPKSAFPSLLFDALNALWKAQGKRPYNFQIKEPVSGEAIVNIEL